MAMSADAASMQPSVHFLEFSEEINPANDWDRFHVLWQLDASRAPKVESDSSDDAWRGVSEGDLVVFPSLLAGAGEFEAVRFVGPRTGQASDEGGDEGDVVPLLTAGVEHPEFPSLIVSMADERGVPLRDLYEGPFDAILQSQPGKFTLFDVFSRDEEGYREFWDDVPVARRRRPPSGSPWKFSLGECTWIRTLDGKSLARQAGSEQKGGEL